METYITIKEAAELKGCSTQYLRKIALNGTIKSKQVLNNNNRPQYLIPLSALDERSQMKYHKQHGVHQDELPEDKPEKPKKSIEELNEQQRQQVADWITIIEDWQRYRNQYNGSKKDADTAFIALAAEKYSGYHITYDVLCRKYKLFKNGDKAALADERGYSRKGASCIPNAIWDAFLYYYLDQKQHPVKKCYEYTKLWAETEQPQLLPLPACTTFYRHIDSDINESIKTLGRCGEKAFKDRFEPYIRRTYDNMSSNDWWIADNHTLDIITEDNGKKHRLYLTAFMDARAGIMTGIYITRNPSSQATLIALRKGIKEYGIPLNIYVDNGREFLTRDVGGLGHRKKKLTKEEYTPPPVFTRLGINMTNAIVRNAKAKIIERRFLDFKNSLSRLFDTFTGGNILEKPEQLKSVLKKGMIPQDEEFIPQLEGLIKYYFNYQEYNGAVSRDKGKLKQQVYEDNLINKRVAEDSDLNLMLMRSSKPQKVGRRGVHLDISGQRIDYFNSELLNLQGQTVYYRYDPEDLKYIRIYDLNDRYLMTVPADSEAICEYGASKDDVSNAVKKVKEYGKVTKAALNAQKTMVLGKHTALELVLAKAEKNKSLKIIQANPVLSIHRANENQLDEAVGGSSTVDIDRMIRSAEARKNRKDE